MKSKALCNAAVILGHKLFYFVDSTYLEALNLLHDEYLKESFVPWYFLRQV